MTPKLLEDFFPLKREYPHWDYVIAMWELTKKEDNIYSKAIFLTNIFKLVKNEIHERYREQLDENAMNCAVLDFMKKILK